MNTYTAHYYHHRMQTEVREDFLSPDDQVALREARNRWADLSALEKDGQLIWSQNQSLYAAWALEGAESLGELAGRLAMLADQVQAARQAGLELSAPTANGWIVMKETR